MASAPEAITAAAAQSEQQAAEEFQVERFAVTANFAPPSANEDARTIDAVWYTGAKVPRFDWRTGEEYDLILDMKGCRMDRLNNGGPLLDSHAAYGVADQLGVVRKAWAKKGAGMATIQFSKRDAVTPVWNDVKGGHHSEPQPWDVDLQEGGHHPEEPGAQGVHRRRLGAVRDLSRAGASRRGHDFHVGGRNAAGATECSGNATGICPH